MTQITHPVRHRLAGHAARLTPYLLGVLTAVAVGLVATVHEPDYAFALLGKTYAEATRLKAWIANVVLALAAVQLVLALWIYGRLPGRTAAPRWAHRAHRANGFLTVALTLPAALHCVVAYGFQAPSSRLLVHSAAGCAFYGLFVAKVCLVRQRAAPAWALPIVGGLLISMIAVLWYSAALWVFHHNQIPLLN